MRLLQLCMGLIAVGAGLSILLDPLRAIAIISLGLGIISVTLTVGFIIMDVIKENEKEEKDEEKIEEV